MYLGIDISKESLDCYQILEAKQEHKQFRNTVKGIRSLMNWLKNKDVHTVMEATGVYWETVAYTLNEEGYKVSVVNPAAIKYFAKSKLRRGKTDKMDAELLALYADQEKPKLWQAPSKALNELKLLVRERDDLVLARTKLKNQAHAHKHRKDCSKLTFSLLKDRLNLLNKQIKQLEQAILKLCQTRFQKSFDVLTSVPGIALITAAVLIAETENLEGFLHSKQLTAYAGIAPEPNQSGTRQGRARISKIGNPRIRQAMYMAAKQARHKAMFKDFYLRLLSKGKPPKLALVAIARKLLVIAFALVQSKQRFDPDFLSKKQTQKLIP